VGTGADGQQIVLDQPAQVVTLGVCEPPEKAGQPCDYSDEDREGGCNSTTKLRCIYPGLQPAVMGTIAGSAPSGVLVYADLAHELMPVHLGPQTAPRRPAS
jgi:hypothetical protein